MTLKDNFQRLFCQSMGGGACLQDVKRTFKKVAQLKKLEAICSCDFTHGNLTSFFERAYAGPWAKSFCDSDLEVVFCDVHQFFSIVFD